MTYAPHQLDPEVRQYLSELDATSGRNAPGLFIRRSAESLPNPRAGATWMLLLGIVALAGVVAITLNGSISDYGWLPIVQGLLATIGCVGLFAAISKFRRPKPTAEFQSFLYADALHLWEVRGNSITAYPLDNLRSTTGTHTSTGYAYLYTTLQLVFTDRQVPIVLAAKTTAEQLMNFLDLQIALRNSEDESVRLSVRVNPGRATAWAASYVRTGGGDFVLPESIPNPPMLQLVTSDPHPENAHRSMGWFPRLAIACGIGALAWQGCGILDRFLEDERLFAAIPEPITGNSTPHDDYLKRYPEGRHLTAVLEMRDDQMFRRAQLSADANDSPSSLRDYLADNRNTRHRAEASQAIGVYYDRAIADLKKRADNSKDDDVSPELLQAMVAVLESLKNASSPVITIGFQHEAEPLPKTAEQKATEQQIQDIRMQAEPRLKDVAATLPGGSPILPLGDTFLEEQIAIREKVIFERIRAAFQQAIQQDVLEFDLAEAGAIPTFQVAYRIFPSGRLYLYTDSDNNSIKGLLRGYDIAWTIRIRPDGDKREFTKKIQSEPLRELKYDANPSDPAWAPYAVILYSSFYDMSARLIRGFALNPGTAPNSFSFSAVASNQAANPPGGIPGMPGMPGGVPLPGMPNWDPLKDLPKFGPKNDFMPKFQMPEVPPFKVPEMPMLPPIGVPNFDDMPKFDPLKDFRGPGSGDPKPTKSDPKSDKSGDKSKSPTSDAPKSKAGSVKPTPLPPMEDPFEKIR
ncbi:hypothetical protein [Tuwongella immobilis]|uniref:Uncharacterized protein n=1 Tax=Tuwongella immobilis TaxID=692036 RepID=A0A6C2YKT9_9BACT|nr:hypothetical protein [Tuwongella immobilis]VIP01849.1 Uncharacterized protein OS=Plesiocystis pacifica SIR-1 GN=PPSIR1_16150 PE=4 SV=1 [Tuwongella immobilis]VTR99635.1 Uncharacterized protein OS=Plesiocystis pacifica SIR-1 GN=PPSIR1_16150 PE=4 SV=1 [Tuwongella immobilis]